MRRGDIQSYIRLLDPIMRTVIPLVILLFMSNQLFGQLCECKGMVNWESDVVITLLDEPGGTSIGTYQNDKKNENFLVFDFLNSRDNHFTVNIKYSINGQPQTGWIKKGEYLGTYMSNYVDGTTLNFYSEPNLNSSVNSSINKWNNNFYTITNCNGSWVKVSAILDGVRHSGWVERK